MQLFLICLNICKIPSILAISCLNTNSHAFLHSNEYTISLWQFDFHHNIATSLHSTTVLSFRYCAQLEMRLVPAATVVSIYQVTRFCIVVYESVTLVSHDHIVILVSHYISVTWCNPIKPTWPWFQKIVLVL